MRTVNFISQLIIPVFILFTVIYGYCRKVRVYDSFVSGAKEGIPIVINIFPYILAIFVAIKAFQASGAFAFASGLFSGVSALINVPIEVLSLAVIKPLSGSASTGIFTEIVKTTGVDSQASMMAGVIIGSAETTFYVLAVYLGAVGIKKTRYLVPVCVLADIVGIIVSIAVVKLIF